ncbi:MAG: hypothetical protein LBQ22_05595 [Bacteroidales bacterium]|jgi:hypothetical protein|nr:hypothetical protein [Bacteroidales bacterium]
MIVKCIKNPNGYYLTVGKSYEVLKRASRGYWIINDVDVQTWYPFNLFEE